MINFDQFIDVFKRYYVLMTYLAFFNLNLNIVVYKEGKGDSKNNN